MAERTSLAPILLAFLGAGVLFAMAGTGKPATPDLDAELADSLPERGPDRKRPDDGWPEPLPGNPRPSAPHSIAVPKIEVNAPITEVGERDDGTVEVPPVSKENLAGWLASGPRPGDAGGAVIIGHRDTRTGPAVFARLGTLRRGDAVAVVRKDATVIVFLVKKVQQVGKDAFPWRRVTRKVPGPALRLITCGGRYDPDARSYDDNVIVYGDFAGWYRLEDLQ